jgi:5,10-methenyltetrahydrofolate synthetase
MDSTKPTKEELRRRLQKARSALGEKARHEKSETIAARLLETVKWSDMGKVHCFEPIMRLGEVDLVDFVAALQAGEINVRVYTSRKHGSDWRIEDADTDEPVGKTPVFDAVIVPMLGFDPKTLHRVGYGGGYYDRLLADQPTARKIGVCFETGKVAGIRAEQHDIPMDMIVTEKGVHTRTL